MMTVSTDGLRRGRAGRSRLVRLALSLAISAISAALIHAQSEQIRSEVAVAKSEKKKEITIAGPRVHYRLAGALEQVLQQQSALLLRTERIASHAVWPDGGGILTWHTFRIESRLSTHRKIAEPAHDPAHRHTSCDERRRNLGFDRLRLRTNEIALYFPGGSLTVDGVLVRVLGWQTIWPAPKGRYLVFGELCDDARFIELAHGSEGWFQVSDAGVITPVVETSFTREIARLRTVQNLRQRIEMLSR